MKELLIKFLDREISRRSFIHSMAALGLSMKSIDSVLGSVAHADTEVPFEGKSFTGTGAEVLLETLKSAGITYIFNSNSTGQSCIIRCLDRSA